MKAPLVKALQQTWIYSTVCWLKAAVYRSLLQAHWDWHFKSPENWEQTFLFIKLLPRSRHRNLWRDSTLEATKWHESFMEQLYCGGLLLIFCRISQWSLSLWGSLSLPANSLRAPSQDVNGGIIRRPVDFFFFFFGDALSKPCQERQSSFTPHLYYN